MGVNIICKLAIASFLVVSVAHTVTAQQPIERLTVGDAFESFELQLKDLDVAFRANTIQFIGRLDDSLQTQVFDLLRFRDNVASWQLEGLNLLSEEMRMIENKNMAAVLGSESMNVEKFEKLLYTNSESGTKILVSVTNGQLDFQILDLGDSSEFVYDWFAQDNRMTLGTNNSSVNKNRVISDFSVSKGCSIKENENETFSISGLSKDSHFHIQL